MIEQLLLILGLTYTSEIIVNYFDIPFPGSVLGMLVLFVLLKFNIIKLSAVEKSGNKLLEYLPIMFVPLGVGIYAYIDQIKNHALNLLGILSVTTIIVMLLSGWMVQFVKRRGENDVVQ